MIVKILFFSIFIIFVQAIEKCPSSSRNFELTCATACCKNYQGDTYFCCEADTDGVVVKHYDFWGGMEGFNMNHPLVLGIIISIILSIILSLLCCLICSLCAPRRRYDYVNERDSGFVCVPCCIPC